MQKTVENQKKLLKGGWKWYEKKNRRQLSKIRWKFGNDQITCWKMSKNWATECKNSLKSIKNLATIAENWSKIKKKISKK